MLRVVSVLSVCRDVFYHIGEVCRLVVCVLFSGCGSAAPKVRSAAYRAVSSPEYTILLDALLLSQRDKPVYQGTAHSMGGYNVLTMI